MSAPMERGRRNSRRANMARKLSAAKAKKMLHEGKARGHKLTKKQRGLFGAIASGKSRRY